MEVGDASVSALIEREEFRVFGAGFAVLIR